MTVCTVVQIDEQKYLGQRKFRKTIIAGKVSCWCAIGHAKGMSDESGRCQR
jgi:hypothetical protein